jgi:hypothetical protein
MLWLALHQQLLFFSFNGKLFRPRPSGFQGCGMAIHVQAPLPVHVELLGHEPLPHRLYHLVVGQRLQEPGQLVRPLELVPTRWQGKERSSDFLFEVGRIKLEPKTLRQLPLNDPNDARPVDFDQIASSGWATVSQAAHPVDEIGLVVRHVGLSSG